MSVKHRKIKVSRTNLETSGTYADPKMAGEDGGMSKKAATDTRGATFRSEGKRFGIKPARNPLTSGGEGSAAKSTSKNASTAGGRRFGMEPATSEDT